MANIRKTFNFRNGVQVDDDNLVVDSLGKVGIGTSVPTEFLDVRGIAKVVGLVTASQIYTNSLLVGVTTDGQLGVATVNSLTVGSNISISNGIITATSGVVTFFGDGGGLINLPSSQWIDVNTGFGYTSIYAQGFVGVGTIYPLYTFQVGGTEQTREFSTVGATGVGIDSTGNVYATGILTASNFVGSGIGLTQISANSIESGTLSNDRLPASINLSGIITAQTNFSGTLIGNVIGDLTGNVTGIAQTADSITTGIGISVGIVTSNILTANSLTVGVITSTSKIHSQGSVGVGTQNPQTSLHIFSTSGSAFKVQNNTGESYVSIGTGFVRNQNNLEISFGNETRSYSGSSNAVDFVNYAPGPINYYLHEGPAGVGTGAFNWVYGQDDSLLMTLTYGGKLGLGGVSNPQHELHVGGSSTITDTSYFGDNLYIANTLYCGGLEAGSLNISALSAPEFQGNVLASSGISTFTNLLVNGNFTPQGNIGINTDSTTNLLEVYGGETIPGEARWSNPPTNTIYNQKSKQLFANLWVSNGKVGILTDTVGLAVTLPNVGLNALGAVSIFNAVGVGTTNPACAVDFSTAGSYQGVGGTFRPDQKRYMLLPRVTSTQRSNLILSSTPFFSPDSLNGEGAVIYNTTTKTFQGYNGSSWSTLGGASGLANVGDDTSPELGGNLNLSGFNIFGTGFVNISGVSTITTLSVSTALTAQSLQVSGISTFNNTVKFGSNNSISTIDSGNSLRIDANTDVNILGTYGGTKILSQPGANLVFVDAVAGDVSLYYQTGAGSGGSSKRLQTLGTGVTVTGTTFTTDLSVSGTSTLAGLTTVTTDTLSTKQSNVSGITTARDGFTSGIGTAVQITTIGNQLIFTVPGVGTTSLILY